MELSFAIDTIHPLTRVSFCSTGSIKVSTGIECTAQDATYFPSLKIKRYSVKPLYTATKYSYIRFHILIAPSWPPDRRYCCPET
jgi:hypothetical protein